MTESVIVPIEQNENENAIQTLIVAKERHQITDLARLDPAQIDEILRGYYLQAAEQKLILMVNLWVRELVGPQTSGVFEWRSTAITGDVQTVVVYDSNTGTTKATVGNLVVLSNEIAGRELLRPGQWLHRLHDAYRQREATIRHTEEIEAGRVAQKTILDFVADV